MSVPVIAFFNNKGGVGKTSLVYHLAWMLSELDTRVLAADLDPQANLTAAFLDEDVTEELWDDPARPLTVYACLQPLLKGTGDIAEVELFPVEDRLALIAGDLGLSQFEDELSSQWPFAMGGKERAFRVLSALWRIVQQAAARAEANVVLVDLGPNLGAINRAALISADYVVIPLAPDLFSMQGLRNVGPAFRRWRQEWADRLTRRPDGLFEVPRGRMEPLGYIVLQHSVRLDRPVKAYEKWIARIPCEYRRSVLKEADGSGVSVADDPHSLALLRHYRSLMPMAQEARKPIFHLKPADGAIGAHMQSVHDAYRDFRQLALTIRARAGIAAPI
ncbi:MAG: AAA family ATPase [Acidobacteria bacterium]|nr:AAA family ATPase [Acidobacteriota bacterium]